MDRVINYSGSIPRSVDLLQTNRNVLTALGMLAQEIFGTSTIATGFATSPSSPAGLSVSVAAGRLYSLQETDPLQFSTLPADTADLIVKQGIVNVATTLSCPAPATSGYSVNYLVEAAFEEQDTNAVVLPYYNANNPTQPFSGPNNSGSANYTNRQDTVQLQVKAGTPATTGTQVTPAPDSGFVGLAVITVAYGQTQILAGNISQYPAAPLVGGSLLQAIQGNAFTYGADVGAANAYAVNYAPAIATLVDGMTLEFQAAFANTGASTFSPNGMTAYPILGGAHAALQGGEIASGGKCVLMWKANITSWILLESTGGSVQVPAATKSNQAVNFSQIKGLSNSSQTVFTPALSTGYPRTLTFTAPSNGYVWAQQNINVSNNSSTVSLGNSISITGGASEGDTTTYPEQNVAVQYVTAGTAVTVTGTLTTGASGATAVISQCLSYIFIPSN